MEPGRRIGILKDPWSATTHFAGFLAAIVGAIVLVLRAPEDPLRLATVSTYGLGLVGLFLASSLYHFFDLGDRANHWLRRVDHAAIFLFIAACFGPPVLALLQGQSQWILLGTAGGLGLAGAVFKLVWFRAPLWLDMTGYLGFGWLGVLVVPAAAELLPLGSVLLLVLGGLCYTLGAVVFILERPDPRPGVFGHHEIWHLFVLGGAICHYAFNYRLLGM